MGCDPDRSQKVLLWCLYTGVPGDSDQRTEFFAYREAAKNAARENNEQRILDHCYELLKDHDKQSAWLLAECHRENPGTVLGLAKNLIASREGT